MDRSHHALEHRIKNPPSIFRIAIGQQLQRSFEIGEENGDVLALSLERGPGGPDEFGEVRWRVGLWRRGAARFRGAGRGQALAALAAESRSWSVRLPAPWTCRR